MSDKNALAIIILAAGKGTRMKSNTPKVMHELAGKPMINWLLDTCESLSPDKIITVIGPDMDDLAAVVSPHKTAIQENRNGTGGAVKCALPALEGFGGNVLILMGDEPLVDVQTLKKLIAEDGLSVQGFDTPTPHGLGRMVLNNNGTLKGIVEDADCDDDQREITLCNAGNYCVPADKLGAWIEKIGDDNAQGEFYLTDLPEIAAKDGVQTHVVQSHWAGPWGVNDRVQLAEHEKMAQNILRKNAMLAGVSMQDPDTVYLWHDTKIESGVTIEPSVFFGPKVTIEKDVHIKAFCHFEGAHVKSGATIGPFARLRPDANIGEDVRIGNFVEVKKSNIGKGSKISHLAYVGDTEMGEDVNFSCGAITVNYDGFNKHTTVIGNNAMVGSNVSLVAPITIGDGAFLAAGSTLTSDVESDALSFTRPETQTKKGWAARFRKIKAASKNGIFIAALIGISAPAMACEGFKNSMSALEAVVAQHQRQAAAQSSTKSLPHMTSLNQDLDALEKAVADHYAKQAAVKPVAPQTPPQNRMGM